ncbi:NAD-dependent dehydratase [Lactiplantibacillus fabifermentans T30PCM01]|uniref:NAD-dependent dehydratase n=1 Tax=Lactiplantibacillus fabifermentans T30PCM01 TaxID=1400520 RepID=W6T4V4_9LACO|nr:NAD(P)H-binding protein [Lactiplantibacillus fabifermentans]ETY72813.1 NAD-dependent dehydratase [Lactiplantibacillus fabifermentans T30PCM01]
MKILVVGASGRVGFQLSRALQQAGHTVVGTYSHHQPDLPNTAQLDLHAAVSEMRPLMTDVDVVYFVAGSRGKDLLQTDLNGAIKVMQAAEQSGVPRFIQLSSAYALQPDRWHEGYLQNLTDYNIAKRYADEWLMRRTNLDYTILQPGVLTTEPATGLVSLDETTLGDNPISDVVAMLVAVLTAERAHDRVIMMKSGQTPINTALATL